MQTNRVNSLIYKMIIVTSESQQSSFNFYGKEDLSLQQYMPK